MLWQDVDTQTPPHAKLAARLRNRIHTNTMLGASFVVNMLHLTIAHKASELRLGLLVGNQQVIVSQPLKQQRHRLLWVPVVRLFDRIVLCNRLKRRIVHLQPGY